MIKRAIVVAFALLVSGRAAADSRDPLIYYGAQSGHKTLDEGEGERGGNPFAAALIGLLGEPDLRLGGLPDELAAKTRVRSRGLQNADVAATPANLLDWPVNGNGDGDRIALVIVVADYSHSDSAPSLPGAASDARRVAAALTEAGWRVLTVLDADRSGFERALSDFAKRSEAADASLIYTTGHGVEIDGQVRVIMGDFPVAAGVSALEAHSVRLSKIAAAGAARRVNLIFYAGCRDNPFAAPPTPTPPSPAPPASAP
jgi:hypothetical protein